MLGPSPGIEGLLPSALLGMSLHLVISVCRAGLRLEVTPAHFVRLPRHSQLQPSYSIILSTVPMNSHFCEGWKSRQLARGCQRLSAHQNVRWSSPEVVAEVVLDDCSELGGVEVPDEDLLPLVEETNVRRRQLASQLGPTTARMAYLPLEQMEPEKLLRGA